MISNRSDFVKQIREGLRPSFDSAITCLCDVRDCACSGSDEYNYTLARESLDLVVYRLNLIYSDLGFLVRNNGGCANE